MYILYLWRLYILVMRNWWHVKMPCMWYSAKKLQHVTARNQKMARVISGSSSNHHQENNKCCPYYYIIVSNNKLFEVPIYGSLPSKGLKSDLFLAVSWLQKNYLAKKKRTFKGSKEADEGETRWNESFAERILALCSNLVSTSIKPTHLCS